MQQFMPVIGYLVAIVLLLAVILPFWHHRDRLKKYRENGYRDGWAACVETGVDSAKKMLSVMDATAYAEGFRNGIKDYEER